MTITRSLSLPAIELQARTALKLELRVAPAKHCDCILGGGSHAETDQKTMH